METDRRPQLPALSCLEVDKAKREEEVYQARNAGTGTPQSLPTSAGTSPSYQYPPGPPPPYSHINGAPPTNTWTPRLPVHTPPESRRTSEHEKEATKPRQSLPSLSEALGEHTAFASTHSSHPQTTALGSPTHRRSYPMEPPQPPPTSYPTTTYSPYSQHRSESSHQSSYTPAPETARSAPAPYTAAHEHRPSLHLQTPQALSHPPPPQSSTGVALAPEASSSAYEKTSSHTSASMPPTSTTSGFAYGYTSYPPRYANPPSSSHTTSGPIYQPSTVYGAPQTNRSSWKSDASHGDDRSLVSTSFGENVKRHLDFYDLEAALNEIASTSGILSDFSRRYGDRMHQTQRSGTTINTLPGIVEVDDMINKSRVAHDSLMKIRDVVLQQQAVYEQQAADQRQQHHMFDQHLPPQSDVHEQKIDESNQGGFAGVDTKKRRGRAAPPGRCHSCNRAETPEWRRGPDGARTLCNACGLHYAKLTRKNNGANKSSSVGSSNLRPKENMTQ